MMAPDVGSSSSARPPPWTELPEDVTANILHRLGAVDILESAQKVCTTWRRVCMDPSMWRVIDMRNVSDPPHDLEILCRHAVDRSQGQLIDVKLGLFGSDELLSYISERCNHLKRLTLVRFGIMSREGVRRAVEKFLELEELHLFGVHVHLQDIEIIGTSCPRLTAFTFNRPGFNAGIAAGNDDWALAVAKNMPNLHHLCLLGVMMKNEGLEAILDSCPHLKSLDIRRCFGVDLRGDLSKRCSQKIKDLRCPNDSVDDCNWLDLSYDSNECLSHSFSFEDYHDYMFDCVSYSCFCEDYDYYMNRYNQDDFPDPEGARLFDYDDYAWHA